MKLYVGQRLAGMGPTHEPGGYVVTGVVAETRWYGLYTGKKIFYNFDFTNKLLRETEETEWLDVYLRTVVALDDDPVYLRSRRDQARAEIRRVLAMRSSNLWPEPIDLLEISSHESLSGLPALDDETALDEREPVVVFARPHGQFLGDWQKKVVPLASILSVLAELLDLVRQAHAAGLVLQGLGPAAVLVDPSDRVHYLGADLAVEENQAAAGRAHLIPRERWPRGFTAAELYETRVAPDPRSDLHSWGALAYFLLTRQSPWQIALEQGQPWAHFEERHFAVLESSLRTIPVEHRRSWAEQLGLGEEGLLARWPANVVAVFRALLHHDPARRPASVEELLGWIESPPPLPVNALVALIVGPGEAKIRVDLGSAGEGLDLVIRRNVGQAARTHHDGTLIFQGPAVDTVVDPAVPLTPAPVYYTAFLRRATSLGPNYSAAGSAELIDATPAALRQLAESQTGKPLADGELPAPVELCFQTLEPAFVGEALLASDMAVVRTWAVVRLGAVLRQLEASRRSAAERLLWKILSDPASDLAMLAARIIVAAHAAPSDELVLNIVRNLARGDLDQAEKAVASLEKLVIDADQAKRVTALLEGERPLICPECQVQLPRRLRAEHLGSVHGYLAVGGSLLPRPVALARLWDRVLAIGDTEAHAQLVAALAISEQTPASYVSYVEEELARRGKVDREDNGALPEELANYVNCLARVSWRHRLVPGLMHSEHPLVRALGRALALAVIAGEVAGQKIDARALRAMLNRLAPEFLEETILVCRRLGEIGIDAATVAGCLNLLQNERLTTCSECAATVRIGDLETHLRRAHSIFQFRGVRRSFPQIRALVVDAAFGPPPDPEAWRSAEELAQERHGRDADRRLVTWVCQRLIQLKRKRRAGAMAGLTALLASQPAGARLLPLLCRRWKEPTVHVLARHLALETVRRMPAPVAPALIEHVKPLLAARELSRALRWQAVEALLKSTGPSSDDAMNVLHAYVAQSGKLRAIDKLRRLEKRIGKSAAIDVLCARLEDQVRMDCPRCGVQFRRADMVRHLWDEHHLLLEGRRVREPWRVLEDWVVDYRLEKDQAVLERCRDLARKLDGATALIKLQQLLLRHGIEDDAARAELSERAREQHSGICPHCYGLVPLPQKTAPAPLSLDDHVLQGAGYRLELVDFTLVPGLIVDGPAGRAYRGWEPGRGLSRLGGLVFLVGPLALAAFFATRSYLGQAWPVAFGIMVALGIGMFLAGLLVYLWPSPRPGRDRLIDAAWKKVVPELLAAKWTGSEALFLGRLAQSSHGVGDAAERADDVEMCLAALESWARQDSGGLPHLAAMWRLAAEDSLPRGDDPLPQLVDQAAGAFQGTLPLDYAEVLLGDLFSRPGSSLASWPRGRLRRLQVLLVEGAFTAGLKVSDLAEIGRTSTVLAAALGCGDLDRLAQLQQLWELRARHPWKEIGAANTVFDLAGDPDEGERALEDRVDLLLVDRASGVVVSSDGVWFRDVCFTSPPESIAAIARGLYEEDGFDLVAGTHRFWFAKNPKALAEQLESWLRYYFREFVPQLKGRSDGPLTDHGRRLLARNVVDCPHCHRDFRPGMGQIGLPIESAAGERRGVSAT